MTKENGQPIHSLNTPEKAELGLPKIKLSHVLNAFNLWRSILVLKTKYQATRLLAGQPVVSEQFAAVHLHVLHYLNFREKIINRGFSKPGIDFSSTKVSSENRSHLVDKPQTGNQRIMVQPQVFTTIYNPKRWETLGQHWKHLYNTSTCTL